MNATATAMAVEPTPVVDMATKHERYTAPQIEELRQRVQVTGKVIAPVLRSLAEEMFHHGVSNECVREGLQRATGLGLQQDVDECVQKWGIDVNHPPTESDSQRDLTRAFDGIWRDALVDAFVDWTFSQEGV